MKSILLFMIAINSLAVVICIIVDNYNAAGGWASSVLWIVIFYRSLRREL